MFFFGILLFEAVRALTFSSKLSVPADILIATSDLVTSANYLSQVVGTGSGVRTQNF
jgi:hypothetical protein